MPFTMPGKKRPLPGGGSASPAPAATAAASSPAAPGPRASSGPGYVNFARLLAVNQGGAQKMADTLAGKAEQRGQQASTAINTAQQTFSDKVAAGTAHYAGQPKVPTTSRTTDAPSAEDPAAYRTAGAIAAENAQRAQYTGPKEWADIGVDPAALSKQAAEAANTAKGLTTAGGRAAQLREGTRGPYGAGMSSMDAALSGAALGPRGRNLSDMYGGLSQKLIDARAAGGGLVNAAQAESADTAKQHTADSQMFTSYANDLDARAAAQALPPPEAPPEPEEVKDPHDWNVWDTASVVTGTPLNFIFGNRRTPVRMPWNKKG